MAFQAGLVVSGGALDGDSTSERLLEAAKGDADGQLLLGVSITGLGIMLLAATVTYLFYAVRSRQSRVLGPMIAMADVGAVLMASGLILNNFAYLDAADTFAEAEATREAPPPADPDEAEDQADDRAEDAISDAPGATAGALMVRGGALLFSIGFFYTALWAMRTGLMTRFWGSLGMASAVVMALFFLYFFALVWFLAVGFMLLGLWIGGRPPAWDSGTSMPWPKPGEPDPERPRPARGPGHARGKRPGGRREAAAGGRGARAAPAAQRPASAEAQAPPRLGGSGRRSRHQLDPVPARGDREGAVGAPELARVLDLEAGSAEPLLRLGVVGDDDGGVAQHRRRVPLGEDDVDLGPLALDPEDRVPQLLRHLHGLEADQLPELDDALALAGRHLDRDVLEHAPKLPIGSPSHLQSGHGDTPRK